MDAIVVLSTFPILETIREAQSHSNAFSAVYFFFTGALMIGASVPLIRGRIPPNPLYGLRTSTTLRCPEIWYPANAYAAWRLLWTGIAVLVGSIGLYLFPGMSAGGYALAIVAILLLGTLVTLVQSLWFIRKLRNG